MLSKHHGTGIGCDALYHGRLPLSTGLNGPDWFFAIYHKSPGTRTSAQQQTVLRECCGITRRTARAAGNDVARPTLRMSPPTTARALGVLNGAE
ncbi:hypothetical protein ACLKA6_002271 [Drosophila palustris]